MNTWIVLEGEIYQATVKLRDDDGVDVVRMAGCVTPLVREVTQTRWFVLLEVAQIRAETDLKMYIIKLEEELRYMSSDRWGNVYRDTQTRLGHYKEALAKTKIDGAPVYRF